MTTCQGEDRGTRIMTALEQARPAVLLLYQPASLTALVRAVKGLTQNQVASMFTCAQHSTEVQEWFDENVSHTYGEIMASLDAVQSAGFASFVIDGDAVVFRLEYEIIRGSHKVTRRKQGADIKVRGELGVIVENPSVVSNQHLPAGICERCNFPRK
jgi:hypothetical protein